MIIIFGTKTKREPLGRVAEFCVVCRRPVACQAVAVKSVGHLFFIADDSRGPEFYELTCEACGYLVWPYPPTLRGFAKDSTLEFKELVERTNPSLYEKYAGRMELEERVRRHRATPDERYALLCEPFLQAEQSRQYHARSRGFEALKYWFILLAFVSVVVFMFAVVVLTGGEPGPPPWQAHIPFMVAGTIIIWIAFVFGLERLRFPGRVMKPMIVRSLALLQPSLDELGRAAAMLYSSGLGLPSAICAKSIHAQVSRLVESAR